MARYRKERAFNHQDATAKGGNMTSRKYLQAAVLCCAGFGSSLAMAQDVPDHPRVNEVNQRLDNQQASINQGLANGTRTRKRAARSQSDYNRLLGSGKAP